MKFRRAAIAVFAVGAILTPATALADVHATISVKHVKRDGKTKLKFSGELHYISGPDSCTRNRGIVVQHRKNKSSSWNGIGRTSTNDNGAYSKITRHKQGHFRVRVPKDGSCTAASSGTIKHKH